MDFFRRAINRVGRRGYFLMFCGLLGLIYGWYLVHPPKAVSSSTTAQQLRDFVPVGIIGYFWILTGIICLVQMWMAKDRIAFTAVAFLMFGWGSIYLVGWVTQHLAIGWVSVVIWWTLAGFANVVSGWPEAPFFRGGEASPATIDRLDDN